MVKRTLCFTNPAYLSTRHSQLVLQVPGAENSDDSPSVRTIPIEDIGVLILDNPQITLTSSLMEALMANNVALVTCDSRQMPHGLMLPLEGNTLLCERHQSQIQASLPLKKQLWQQIVRQKIANQSAMLRDYTNAEIGCMKKWSETVRSGDVDNLEARAAAYYWKNLFVDLPDFTRDQVDIAPNAYLNYGYAVLRAIVARSLVGSGVMPSLGIHHHNRYDAYCLADDVMEPYRPFVDKLVISARAKFGDVENLTKEVKAVLLELPVVDVRIEGKRYPLAIATEHTSASLVLCYQGKAKKLLLPEI